MSLFAILSLASALADEPLQAAPSAPASLVSPAPWQLHDRRALRWSRAGAVASIVGPPATFVGFALVVSQALSNESPTAASMGLMLGGVGATLAGTPMLAGGGLRSTTVLASQGASVTRRPGHLAWGLYGASVASGIGAMTAQDGGQRQVAGALAITSAATYVGGVAAGLVQLHENRWSREGLSTITLAPTPGGLAVGATF